jgi:hypothetical protein
VQVGVTSRNSGFEEFWKAIEAPFCFVYKMFDAEHNLLYVVVTGRLKNRMREHYRDKPWVREKAERVEVDGGSAESEARRIEAELISALRAPRRHPSGLTRPRVCSHLLALHSAVVLNAINLRN